MVEVATTADCGQLEIVDFVVEHGGVQAQRVFQQVGLVADLEGGDGFRVGHRGAALEGHIAGLDRLGAEAVGHARIEAGEIVQLVVDAGLPAQLVVVDIDGVVVLHTGSADHQREAIHVLLAHHQALLVVGVAQPHGGGQRLGEVVGGLPEQGPGSVAVADGSGTVETVDTGDIQVGVKIESAHLPLQRLAGVTGQADFLGQLRHVGPVLGDRVEGDEAGAVAGHTAVDIALAQAIGALVGGQAGEDDIAQVPFQFQRGTGTLVFLRVVVALVVVDGIPVEVIAQLTLLALLENIGAEDTRGAVEIALVQVQQCGEIIGGCPQKLRARGQFGKAAHGFVFT